jgi:hypothetical protein
MTSIPTEKITKAVIGIDGWLDTMRGEHGYAGPVAHRWRDNLLYTGPGIDWRYEGIILGYLNLYEKTGGKKWLEKAICAGSDILKSQNWDGTYATSAFELNPTHGGTPHEAACDLALLKLASVLKAEEDTRWELFLKTSRDNLENYHINRLWDDKKSYFHNLAHDQHFVPNKVATLIEALFALYDLKGDSLLIETYITPSLQKILSLQVRDPDSPLRGAIDQSSHGLGRFFPFYIARCIPALLLSYACFEDKAYLQAALNAMYFIIKHQERNGSFPQVVYKNLQITTYPQWIAGVGDILRTADLLEPFGLNWTGKKWTESWLLQGVQPSGGVMTANGFAKLENPRCTMLDFRDVLPVCGWVDKAFRYFTHILPDRSDLKPEANSRTICDCRYWGKVATFYETQERIEVRSQGKSCYYWKKPEIWARKF